MERMTAKDILALPRTDPSVFEDYVKEVQKDPESAQRMADVAEYLIQADTIVAQINAIRATLDISKADIARLTQKRADVIRRLLSEGTKNMRLSTLLEVLDVLECDLVIHPRRMPSDRIESIDERVSTPENTGLKELVG